MALHWMAYSCLLGWGISAAGSAECRAYAFAHCGLLSGVPRLAHLGMTSVGIAGLALAWLVWSGSRTGRIGAVLLHGFSLLGSVYFFSLWLPGDWHTPQSLSYVERFPAVLLLCSLAIVYNVLVLELLSARWPPAAGGERAS